MTETDTASGPIVVLMLHGGPERLKSALERISAAHPGADLLLLTHEDVEISLDLPVIAHWRDGNMRGPLRFLTLSRRLSWASAICGYDVAPTARSRFLRWSVRPSIPWFEVEKRLPPVS